MTDSITRPIFTCASFSALLLALAVGCGPPVAATATGNAAPEPEQVQSPTTKPAASPPVEQRGELAAVASTNTIPPPTVKTSATSGLTLSGRVLFDGPKPQRREINMTKDPTCIKLHADNPVLSEELIVADDGGVQNAFVYIRRGAPKMDYPVPDKAIDLDQKGCMYRPRVQGMLIGQKLKVLNNDPVTHNVRSFPVRNRAFNFGQPAGTGPRERVFDAPEREIEIQCDIHPWMHAYLFVMEHPFFAVTDAGGKYSITGLPAGEYSLAVWHEELGKQQRDVKITEKNVEDESFTFQP